MCFDLSLTCLFLTSEMAPELQTELLFSELHCLAELLRVAMTHQLR